MSSAAPRTAGPTLADVVALLDLRYPPEHAEDWDAVGTVCGDPAQPVRRVLFTIDATTAVVDEAVSWGADLLVAHHPVLLRPVHSVAATSVKGAVVHRLIRAGCGLHAVHTNADAAADGMPQVLAETLGLVDTVPLVPVTTEPLDKHVVFVPQPDADGLIDAMSAAGAGALGAYSRCAWTTTGTGTFVPGEHADPTIGERGAVSRVAEARVEMVAPRRSRAAVVAAMRAAHPYEEPAFDVLTSAALPAATGHGRVGRLGEPMSLRAFAEHVATVLPATAQGVRVAGDLDAQVSRVAVVAGSGDSFFDGVRGAGVDVYVTGDLRHHPALELRERARFEAGGPPDDDDGRPFLIDVAHTAGERPWLARAAAALAADVQERHGTTVETRVSAVSTDPWTIRIPSHESPGGQHL